MEGARISSSSCSGKASVPSEHARFDTPRISLDILLRGFAVSQDEAKKGRVVADGAETGNKQAHGTCYWIHLPSVLLRHDELMGRCVESMERQVEEHEKEIRM